MPRPKPASRATHPPAAVRGFLPIEGERMVVLVLGTMPGTRSLATGEYYAAPRNAFWRTVAPFGIDPGAPYGERCARLRALGIGLWDVLASCDRRGAADHTIANPRPNDVAALMGRHAELRLVLLNGAAAATLFERFVVPPRPVEARRMPSTSPAHARPGKEAVWIAALTDALGQPRGRVR